MRDKKTDKVIAIYHAAEDFIAEGAELSTMRIGDIAAKAGIGKGTTYEYFSSKEEMIVKAMLYLVGSMVRRILDQMEKKQSFQEAFLLLLDEMEEKGIVGPFQGSKPRSILITKEQWEARKNGGVQMDFDEYADQGVPEEI